MKEKVRNAIEDAGRQLNSDSNDSLRDSSREAASNVHAVQYHRGGKVRKTGLARLKKGERVIPKSKVKRVEKQMRKSKMRMRSGR